MSRPTALFLSVLLAFSLQARADQLTPGMYSITTTMESDMPMPMPTQSMTDCLTEEDIARDPKALLAGQQGTDQCEIGDYTITDGKMTASLICDTEGGQMIMNAEGTYDATGYTMISNVQMTAAGMTINMKTTVVDKRIGDC